MKRRRKTIEIPGHEVIIPGSIWKVEAPKWRCPAHDEGLDAMRIVTLSRFREPTDEELIRLIRKEAKLEKGDIGNLAIDIYRTKIHSQLRMLEDSSRKRIIEGDEELMGLIYKHVPETNLQRGMMYAMMSHGIFPRDILNKKQGEFTEDGVSAYNDVINHRCIGTFHFYFRLNKDYSIPDRELVDVLMRSGVKESDVLHFKASSNPDYEVVNRYLDFFYANFESNEELRYACDLSQERLYRKCICVTDSFFNRVLQSHGFPSNMFGGLLGALKSLPGDATQFISGMEGMFGAPEMGNRPGTTDDREEDDGKEGRSFGA